MGSKDGNGDIITSINGPLKTNDNYRTKSCFCIRKFLDTKKQSSTRQGGDMWFIRLRYAEVLLIAVEAALELNNVPVSLGYINQVRDRAGIQSLENTLTLDDIIRERRVELAFEDHRYWDLKRWRLAHLTWTGSSDDYSAVHYALFPFKINEPGDANHDKWVFDKIRVHMTKYPIYFELKNYYNFVDQDGTLSCMLFNGDYRMVTRDNNGPWSNGSQPIEFRVKGKTEIEFKATPYYTLSNVNITRDGNSVTGACTINKVDDSKAIEAITLYIGKTEVSIVIPSFDISRLPIEIPPGMIYMHEHYPTTRGSSSYYPIPYQKSCKITVDNVNRQYVYHVNYRTYEPDYGQLMRGLIVRISFDGIQTVYAPLSDFSGACMGAPRVDSWYMGADGKGDVNLRFVMPYKKGAKIELENITNYKIDASIKAYVSDWIWRSNTLYFYAGWRQENGLATNQGRDYIMATLTGRGVFKGDVLSLYNYSPRWYGDLDSKMTNMSPKEDALYLLPPAIYTGEPNRY